MFFKVIREDIRSIRDRDPAARSVLEVILCYPGLHATLIYRVTHALWNARFHLLARVLSHFAKIVSQVEIHPGAKIGRRFFIDHATGVVIGETAEIGDDVTLYQGVTLGGVKLNAGKRHPTLEDGVIVGAGAQILGPLTVGRCARIGANAVVLRDVPAGASMVGIPARQVMKARDESFQAYGTPTGDIPDPVVRAIEDLRRELQATAGRVAELENELERRDAADRPEEPRAANRS
ncbi:serine O-acetyltransferase [Alphaproteobacteria bacterium HT1-32]|nr:serine O-acetyltransferase [Alphaproteobacteria bacterium HT1-32]